MLKGDNPTISEFTKHTFDIGLRLAACVLIFKIGMVIENTVVYRLECLKIKGL